jgi:hypothetical protein
MSALTFPVGLNFLFQPSRYKVAYGGRGSGKSWGFARALLILGMQKPMRILCAREQQASIQDSVHKLLSDQIDDMGFSEWYEVQKQVIYGKNGSEFIFAGIRSDPGKIKSFEGIDICWVEEAAGVSERSWDFLETRRPILPITSSSSLHRPTQSFASYRGSTISGFHPRFAPTWSILPELTQSPAITFMAANVGRTQKRKSFAESIVSRPSNLPIPVVLSIGTVRTLARIGDLHKTPAC